MEAPIGFDIELYVLRFYGTRDIVCQTDESSEILLRLTCDDRRSLKFQNLTKVEYVAEFFQSRLDDFETTIAHGFDQSTARQF